MSESPGGPIGRRDLLRVGVGLGAAAAVGQPVAAEDDPYDGWFDDVENFEGTVDFSGEETVEVVVGAGDDGLLFEPPAVQVDPDTTVVWEWSGEGGDHNVAEEDDVFRSETVSDEGHTFEHEFTEDDDGEIYRYVCTPHEGVNMLGAVAVGDVIEDTIGENGNGNGNGDDETDQTGGGVFDLFPTQPLSTEGALATVGGVILFALLSPLFFALVLKYVYEDDRPQ